MTEPEPQPNPYRMVAGLQVPLPLIPRIIVAMRARYPLATAGIEDPDAAVRAALRAWVEETLADYEEEAAMAPLSVTIAQTVTSFEERARSARKKAKDDSKYIVDGAATPPATPPSA